MQPSFTCLQSDELKNFIAGEMSSKRVDEIESHLSTCEACRNSLEAIVGDRAWWQDLESAFRSDTTDINYENSEPKEPVCQRLIALLGPTDDPSKLGRIGTYEIIGLLGCGGMGAVFKAHDPGLNRYVAIKILLPHLALSGAARARFRREGRAAAAIIDDCVLPIYAVDEYQEIPYLVMQYTRGDSLQKRIHDRGPLELREILRISMQAARGLAAAHAQGLVHRDVKPSNILLDGNVDRALLTDFGLARAVDDGSLTASGMLAGTPQYMSPEQARAEAVDCRSDLFSLGSVIYAMCTGHAPFRAESSYGVLRLITDKEPCPIRETNPDIPVWLCTIVQKLMAKNAEDRYASPKEVADLLEACLAHVCSPLKNPLPVEPETFAEFAYCHTLSPQYARNRLASQSLNRVAVATRSCRRTLWCTFNIGKNLMTQRNMKTSGYICIVLSVAFLFVAWERYSTNVQAVKSANQLLSYSPMGKLTTEAIFVANVPAISSYSILFAVVMGLAGIILLRATRMTANINNGHREVT